MLVASEDFPIARTRGDDDEVPRLQPRHQIVEVAEAAGQARVGGVPVLDRLEVDHGLVHQVLEDGHLLAVLAAGDVVDPLLGLVGHALGILGRRVRHLHDVGGSADQPPQQRRLGDDARVVGRRGRGGDLVGEVAQVEGAADLVEDPLALEHLDRGDEVDRLAPRVHAAQGLVDAGVGAAVEVLGLEDLDDVGDGLRGEHHGADDRLLGLQILRRDPSVPAWHPADILDDARQPSPLSSVSPYPDEGPGSGTFTTLRTLRRR